jgi:hypothetical protein
VEQEKRNMQSIITWKRVLASGALVLAGIVVQPQAHASVVTLLNWAPVPDGGQPNFPAINYTATSPNGLQTDIGAIGNGDGNLPPTSQLPGGLQVDTPFSAPIAFSFPDSTFSGGTGYYDATLQFTGLAPIGTAVQTPLGPITLDSQALGSGTFTLTSTAPAGSVVLLSGTIAAGSVITGDDGGMAGAAFNSTGVTYTGGVIAAALPAGYSLSGNDMSISMTGVIPAFGINGNDQLSAFTADATGLFDVHSVPEPGMLSLGLVGAASLIMRRRRNS